MTLLNYETNFWDKLMKLCDKAQLVKPYTKAPIAQDILTNLNEWWLIGSGQKRAP